MFKEFKEFISKGSVLDLAVGIVIGAAFGRVVSSFVQDILMPPIGLLLGKVDFANMFVNLSGTQYTSLAEAQQAGAATLNYGLFINSIINFLIVGFAIFLVIRSANKLRRPAAAAPTCPYCLCEVKPGATRCAYCASELPKADS